MEETNSASDRITNYKMTKNKKRSQFVNIKNQRKYNKRNLDWQRIKHKKKNSKRNHFEKPSIKQKANELEFEAQLDHALSNKGFYAGLYKHRQNRLFSKSNTISPDIVNHDFKFHHSLKQLLSLNTDQYLNRKVFIKYYGDNDAQIEGKLTCISASGYYRIEELRWRGPSTYKNKNFEYALKSYSTWLHFNSTRKIYLYSSKCNNVNCKCHDELDQTQSDITPIFTDIIKLKIINYFLHICSYKEEEMKKSALQFLLKDYIVQQVKNHYKYIKDYIDLLQRIYFKVDQDEDPFLFKICGQFAKGRNQNDFDALKKDKDEDWKEPVYFQTEDLIKLVANYKQILIELLENESKKDILDLFVGEKTNYCNNHSEWDTIDIKKTMRVQLEENRTV